MGKKDGKRVDPAKLQAKKARQALKQEKTNLKRTKKELKDGGEEDIEKIIAEFAAKDAARMAVTVSITPQPSRRANFSMTALPSGEMLLFGGEFCDGERTEVYNELFRWNVEKNEWKMIESLNTPPPRCSHQAVLYHDKVYVFGGEYATMDQFYHYRDFWELDLKTNVWTEVEATGDLPSARSGHRMIVWRNYLLMFGGFYEAMREVRWFNDLYIFSFQTRRWTLLEYKANTQVPKPRSGVQLALHAAEDTIYLFGGYSKEKREGSRHEGKIHEDLWMLNLKPCLPSGKSSNLELSKAIWQKISRKGDYPSPRCGSVLAIYKNKAILFGGVYDTEGPRHSLISTFYNDLYAFDMERRRWYKLGIKQKKAPSTTGKKEKKGKALDSRKANAEEDADDDDDGEEEEEEEEEDLMRDAIVLGKDGQRLLNFNATNKDLFGYIDETGTVVYLNIDEEEDTLPEGTPADEILAMEISQKEERLEKTSTSVEVAVEEVQVAVQDHLNLREEVTDKPPLDKAEQVLEETSYEATAIDLPTTEEEKSSYFGRYFDQQKQPCPRINPCLMIRGNTLYIYGGVTEIGDVEVTLDDCWTLDLNKRDEWRKILVGTMAAIVWKGDEEEDGSSRHSSSMRGGEDSDDDDDEDEEEDEDEDDEDNDDEDSEDGSKASDHEGGKKEKTKKVKFSGSKNMSRKEEMDVLRSHFDTTDTNRTPLAEESLRDFYSRTANYWAQAVIDKWHAEQTDLSQAGPLSEKEIKRLGFQMAESRYNELLPLLSRLNELESHQRQDERFYEKKDKEKDRDRHDKASKSKSSRDQQTSKKSSKKK